ncbi:hypothetical protein ACEN2I_02975 [Flavobacterium sp. W22_SRS_FK3]|uniref:hypothetical protein n=1 Tax=Flavobacterium sp. W22_SRS_FK3 TaxID=3240275 RepID=UPI003F93819E
MKKSIFYTFLLLCFFGIKNVLIAQDKNITVTSKRNEDKTIDLYYEKKIPGSYYLGLEFSNVTNCDVTELKTTIYAYNGFLVKLRPLDKSKGINYSMRYYYIMGSLNPKIDSSFQYILPFKSGKKYKIVEANNVSEKFFEAEKPLNWKSYILKSKNADTICSMRKGIVVKIINSYQNDSLDIQYTSKRNLIIVEHADGTIATYKGLKKNGILVKLGQEVYPQTKLGIIEMYSKSDYRLDFSISYLFDKNFNSKQTLKNYKSRYAFIIPNFVTTDGTVKIESGKEYTSFFNENFFTQEFSRSDKKKYIKNPGSFK